MDVASFSAASRVLIVAGKGGVGKTTMTAALARMAADGGLAVLVVELEGRPGIPAAFDRHRPEHPLGYDEAALYDAPGGGIVRGRRLTPDDALLEYLADHGLQRVSKRLVSSGVVDVVATAIPGIRDVLVLGKVKQLEQDGAADLIVVDAPATGHAMTFLTSARGLLDAARSGPVRSQAEDVVALLSDPSRCRVVLVTLPEEMPVSETVEAGYQLEDRAGVQLGPVIVNGWDDLPGGLAAGTAGAAGAAGIRLGTDELAALEAARRFRVHRHELAAEQVERLARELPLPQLPTPALATPSIGPDEIGVLSRALAEGVERLAAEPDGR
jgi:anion-transporting  ArsA/GET3 family ATPase